jgi:diketogulonate reductase-like aldo/keto reductase
MMAAVRAGIDLGLTVIATDLDSEELVGEAIVRRREEVFLVARVPAAEATVDGMAAACAASLRRLGVDAIDLYLVRGRGRIPLQETVEGFGALEEAGLIRNWGMADFALPALAELFTVTSGCAADEVVFDLSHRGIEWDLLDGCHDRGVAVLAACSLDVRGDQRLHALAERHGARRRLPAAAGAAAARASRTVARPRLDQPRRRRPRTSLSGSSANGGARRPSGAASPRSSARA